MDSVTLPVRTRGRTEMIDVTADVARAVSELGVEQGAVLLFVPHTTAAVTVNENADPDVPRDMLHEIDKVIPFEDGYRHAEGNAAAHIKSSLVGPSLLLPVQDGRPFLGTWQAVFFCEFDGPRSRKLRVSSL